MRATGVRFVAVAGDFMFIRDIALVLKARMGAAANEVPTGQPRRPVERVLGWTPRSNEDAIVATAASLMRLGLLKSYPHIPSGTSTAAELAQSAVGDLPQGISAISACPAASSLDSNAARIAN